MQAQVNIQEIRNIMATLKKAGVQKTSKHYTGLVRIETTGYNVTVSGVSMLSDSDLIISKSIMGGEVDGIADVPFAEFDKMLTSLVKNKKAEWVRLDVLDDNHSQLRIQAGNISFKLQIEEKHDLYTRHMEHLRQSYTGSQDFDSGLVARMVKASNFVDKTGLRHNLTRVAIRSEKNGNALIESTDGAMLYRFEMSNGFYSIPQGETAFVSVESVEVLAHVAKQEKVNGGSVLFTPRTARFESGGYTITEWSRQEFDNIRFPDFSQVIPDSAGEELTVGRKELIEAINTVSIVANKSTGRIQLQAEHGTMIVHCSNESTCSQADVEVRVIHGDISARRVYFNWKKLEQALSVLDSNQVCVEFTGRHRPCVIWEPTMKGIETTLVMPMTDKVL